MRRILISSICILCLIIFYVCSCQAASLTVTWDANTEDDLAGYKLYYGTAPGTYGTPLVLGTVTVYQLMSLKDHTIYYIALTAFDTSANESGYSQEVSATTGDETSPDPPKGLRAEPRRPLAAPAFLPRFRNFRAVSDGS